MNDIDQYGVHGNVHLLFVIERYFLDNILNLLPQYQRNIDILCRYP